MIDLSEHLYSSANKDQSLIEPNGVCNVKSALNSLLSPPRCKLFSVSSPSSVSSTSSWQDKINVTPDSNNTIEKIKNNDKQIIVSPNNCTKNTITEIIAFLKSGDSIQYSKNPYIIIKNHLLCPFCKIRIMHKKNEKIICKCGSSFSSKFHRLEISNSIAKTLKQHENTDCYNTIDFIILDSELIMYCVDCYFMKKIK